MLYIVRTGRDWKETVLFVVVVRICGEWMNTISRGWNREEPILFIVVAGGVIARIRGEIMSIISGGCDWEEGILFLIIVVVVGHICGEMVSVSSGGNRRGGAGAGRGGAIHRALIL
jgi:hypothetical protein